MSLTNVLFYKTINDEMFGQLKFNRLTKECWEGKAMFHPTNSEIDIYLFDLEDKVLEEHKQFYKELEERYLEITKHITNILQDPRRSMGYSIHRDFNKFNLAGFSFPSVKSLKELSFSWDMFFTHNSEKLNLSIGMENWKPDKDECYFGE